MQELGFVETSAKQDGRNMTMVMAPHRVVKEQAAKARPARKADGESDSAYDDQRTRRPATVRRPRLDHRRARDATAAAAAPAE